MSDLSPLTSLTPPAAEKTQRYCPHCGAPIYMHAADIGKSCYSYTPLGHLFFHDAERQGQGCVIRVQDGDMLVRDIKLSFKDVLTILEAISHDPVSHLKGHTA